MKPREKIALALTDFFLVMASVVIALGFRYDFDLNAEKFQVFLAHYWVIVGVPAWAMVTFYLLGLYEKVWRYAGTHELVGVVLAASVCILPFQVAVILSAGSLFPRTVLVLAWLICIFICGGVRLLLRVASESMGRLITNTRVVIVGVNDASESIARELTRANRRYTVVGFVDDDPAHRRIKVRGVPVLGQVAELPGLIDAHLVTEVILASNSPALVRQLIEICKGRKVQFRAVPSVADMVEGRFEMSRLRALSIEDLLEREPIEIDSLAVAQFIKGKVVLITGAGGSIGSEIARQINRLQPRRLILVGRGENSIYEIGLELPEAEQVVCDICRSEPLRRLLQETRPHVVFHAAAHKHVPLMEARPSEAVYNNVFGTLGLMEACQEVGVERFVILSTDKAVDPCSVMGATKRLAELLVAKQGARGYAAVRFGNVLGSRGSVVPTFRKQIAAGGPITLTSPEMTRYFMTIPEAVLLVLQAASMAHGGEIYILDMGKPVKIVDLARNLIRLSGFEPDRDIEIRFTGVRPGEKMHEALANEGEGTEPTRTPKILRVTSPPPGGDWPGPALDALRVAAQSGDDAACIEGLRLLLGNYVPFSETLLARGGRADEAS